MLTLCYCIAANNLFKLLTLAPVSVEWAHHLVERVTENGEKPLRTRHCNRLFRHRVTRPVGWGRPGFSMTVGSQETTRSPEVRQSRALRRFTPRCRWVPVWMPISRFSFAPVCLCFLPHVFTRRPRTFPCTRSHQMSTTSLKSHVLGYPRIGANRELKRAVESFWKGTITEDDLLGTAAELKRKNWQGRMVTCNVLPMSEVWAAKRRFFRFMFSVSKRA